jgi:hypothetical protein
MCQEQICNSCARRVNYRAHKRQTSEPNVIGNAEESLS